MSHLLHMVSIFLFSSLPLEKVTVQFRPTSSNKANHSQRFSSVKLEPWAGQGRHIFCCENIKKGFILIVTLGVDSFVVWWPAFLLGTLLALWYFLSFIYHLSNFTFLRLSPIWEFFSSFNNNKKWDRLPFRKSLGRLLFSFEFIFKYSKRWL